MTQNPGRLLAASLATIALCAAACSTASEATPASPAGNAITTQVYSVKDLVLAKAPADGSVSSTTEGAWIQIADLIENIKNATDPRYWETEGTAIRAEESGYLQVEAKPEMQKLVAQVLSDMRRIAAKG